MHICIFPNDDFKIVTIVMMAILAPTILFMEHLESNKTSG